MAQKTPQRKSRALWWHQGRPERTRALWWHQTVYFALAAAGQARAAIPRVLMALRQAGGHFERSGGTRWHQGMPKQLVRVLWRHWGKLGRPLGVPQRSRVGSKPETSACAVFSNQGRASYTLESAGPRWKLIRYIYIYIYILYAMSVNMFARAFLLRLSLKLGACSVLHHHGFLPDDSLAFGSR